MPRLNTAFLCTAAEERGGPVSILSAFINQLAATSLPVRHQITLVGNVEIEESDFDTPHVFVVTATYAEDGENIARIELPTPPWQRPSAVDPDLPLTISLVFPLSLEFRRPGRYWIILTIDGDEVVRKPFKVSAAIPQL